MKPIYIENIVGEYLKDPDISGAIFINGEWGSGKTYYIRNQLSDYIEKQSCNRGDHPENTPEEPDAVKYFKPIYISLNGLINTDSINSQIISELLKIGEKGKVTQFAYKAGGLLADVISKLDVFGSKEIVDVVKNGVNTIDLFGPFLQNAVLCFDDLERIGNKLSIDEILGFINTKFVEHNKIKTIIIGDEKHIKLPEGKEAIKEKIFWRELAFNLDIEDIYSILERRYSAHNVKEFLQKEKEFILLLFDKIEVRNLRTILFAFDIFAKAYSLFENEDMIKIGQEILVFVFSISKEFKENQLNLGNYLKTDTIDKYNPNFFMLSLISAEPNRGDVKSDQDLEFYQHNIAAFNNKYLFIFPLYEYIVTGYFDEKKVKTSIEEHLHKPEKESERKLFQFRTLSNAEFEYTTNGILKKIKDGEISIYSYPSFWELFEEFSIRGLLNVDINNIKQIFDEGLKKASANRTFYEEGHFDYRGDYVPKSRTGREYYFNVREYHQKMERENKKLKIEKIYEILISDKEVKPIPEGVLKFEPIFGALSINALVTLIGNAENLNIYTFNEYIRTKYHDTGNMTHLLLPDENSLWAFQQSLEKIFDFDVKITGVKKFLIGELVNIIEHILLVFKAYKDEFFKGNDIY